MRASARRAEGTSFGGGGAQPRVALLARHHAQLLGDGRERLHEVELALELRRAPRAPAALAGAQRRRLDPGGAARPLGL